MLCMASRMRAIGRVTPRVIAETEAQSEANTTATWDSVWMTLAFIGLTVLVVLGIAILALTRGVTRPIARILDAMHSMQAGQYDLSIIGLGRKDEVGEIADGLEAFRLSLIEAETARRAQEAAKATDQLGRKITEIQAATGSTVEAISRIVKTVSNIQDSSAAIAGAVEQQGAASSEIARNTQRAATGTTDVTANISGVSTAAEMTGAASTQLMTLSSKLNEQSDMLQKEVGAFVQSLNAA